MFDLLKETIKFHIKRRVERGHGSWGFIFPAILVLVLVLWTLRITVITMEYQTTSGTEQSATETDGAVAEAGGLNGETVMLAAETDATSELNSQAEDSTSGEALAASISADEEETTEEETDGNAGIMLADEDGGSAGNSTGTTTTPLVEYTAAECVYDTDTGDFSVELTVNFTLSKDSDLNSNDGTVITDTTNYSKSYTIDLPDGIIVPDDLLYNDDGTTTSTYTGYQTGTYSEGFQFYYVKRTDEYGNVLTDTDGNTLYSLVLVFLDSYLDTVTDTFTGTVTMEGYISASCYDKDSGSILVGGNTYEDAAISITKTEISYDGNETASEDITVMKSGSYDATAGTITYTVTVYTVKGTDTITLTDYFTDSNLSGILGDLVSVEYQTATTTVTTWSGSTGTYILGQNTSLTGTSSTNVSEGSSASDVSEGAYYYYDSDGKLMIVLPKLLEGKVVSVTADTSGNGVTTVEEASAYVITYTYKVDPESQVYYRSTNSVTAETTDETAGATISSTANATVSISGSTMIAKSGSYSSSGNAIIWTITVGDGSTALEGYALTDEMLAELVSGTLSITDASGASPTIIYGYKTGTTVTDGEGNESTTYSYTYKDADGNVLEDSDNNAITDLTAYTGDYAVVIYYSTDGTTIESIAFHSGTKYTISYQTSAGSTWTSQYVTNEAALTYEGTDEGKSGTSYSGTGSVYITGSGSSAFEKTYVSATENSDGDTYTLAWSSSYTVPAGGIPAGTTFTDYVSVYTGTGSHYITSAQASDIISALKAAWGEENITSIQFSSNSNPWGTSDSDWVSADDISNTDATLYYQFRFTTVYDIVNTSALTGDQSSSLSNATNGYLAITSTDGNTTTTVYVYKNDKISYSYSTSANVAGYDTNIYYNNLTDGSTTKSASWTWYQKVVKYGTDAYGNINGTDNTTVTTSAEDGTVSWIVRVVLDSTADTYTITDTLPAGVTLSELYVSKSGSNYGYSQVTTADSSGTALESSTTVLSGIGTFAYSTATAADSSGGTNLNVQTVTLTVSNITSGVSMLYIKYICDLSKDAATTINYSAEDSSVVESYVYSLTNSVAVTTSDNTEYGSDTETATVTWTQDTTSTGELSKDEEFDTNNNIITYSVVINPDAEKYTYTYELNGTTYTEEYGDLTVTDILTYSSFPMNGLAREASLITNSVKLYYATVDSYGTVTKGSELSSSDYSWVYTEDVQTESWREYITKTLELTVPNGTTLVLEYQYLITIISDEGGWTDTSAGVTNQAVLSAEGTELYSTTPISSSAQVSEVKTSGSVNGNTGYTIYKVDEDNFSVTLAGAVYTFYVYDSSASTGFAKVGTFTTGSNGTVSIGGTLVTDDSGNPLYYEVTMSDGSTTEVPVDTICYVVETTAPEDYKVDGTKYYFYFGSTIATLASNCTGYSSDMTNVRNLILSYTNYVTNAHSSDYYAAKTSISVIKRWLDADGEEYTKTDGSLSFRLYRVLILNDGTITSVSEQEGTSSGDDSGDSGDTGGSTSGKVTLNWYMNLNYQDNASAGTLSVATDTSVTFAVSSSSTYISTWSKWYTGVTITDGTNTLAVIDSATSESCTISDETIITGITFPTETDSNYYITVKASSSMSLYFNIDSYSWYVNTVTATAETSSGDSGSTEGDSGSSSGGDSGSTGSETGTTVSEGTIYRANFSALYPSDNTSYFTINEDKSSTDYRLNNVALGWTDDDTSHSETGFFTVTGNLNAGHNTVSWDTDGDGAVDDDEVALDVCLKMETDVDTTDANTDDPTTVSFTTLEGGYLTLVFNSEASSNGVTITDSNGNTRDYYATNNRIYEYFDAGTYTIARLSYCFIFYMQFAEGATETETESDYYIHNFNNGIDSDFYAISGSLSHSYGTVAYSDFSASQCLKMNSSAKITFTTEETGTLYLYLTNPKGSKKVGVMLDGQELIATGTTTADSNGYRIYTLTVRLDAGAHTITRINSTENMLYYIEYVPDNYGGKSWDNADDVETKALGYLYSTDDTTAAAYWSNKELVGTYTLSASDNWSWSSTKIASEYVDTETGEVLGYFVYFIEEDAIYDEDGETPAFITTYLNDSGITGGSIGVSNQINTASSGSTSIAVLKNWSYDTTSEVATEIQEAVASAKITYELYAMMNIYDNVDEEDLTTGDSYEYWFSSVAGDDFYTLGSSASTTPNGGEITYDGTTTDTALKMNNGGMVSFDAPATNGTLTLVFSALNKIQSSSSVATTYYGPDFSIQLEGGSTYTYVYDSETGIITDKNGKAITSDPYSVKCVQYDKSANIAVFQLTLESAGNYTIKRANSTECYLYYINYTYQYRYLTDGILTKTGTLTAFSTITDGTDTTYWAKQIAGLPLYIYDDDGEDIIGTYSYYVKETGVTMTINDETVALNYVTSNSGGYYTYTYEEMDVSSGVTYTYTYAVAGTTSVKEADSSSGGTVIADGTITAGTAIIANTVKVTSVSSQVTDEYILPATGGSGTIFCYAIASLIFVICAATILIRNRRQDYE